MECPVVNNSDHASIRNASNWLILTPEREAETACKEYDRKQPEEEVSLNENIEKLCKELWPAPGTSRHRLIRYACQTRLGRVLSPTTQEQVIKRMEGRDLNYITSITILPTYTKDGHDLSSGSQITNGNSFTKVDREVGILSYVRKHTDTLVPCVIKSDLTTQTALGKPYILPSNEFRGPTLMQYGAVSIRPSGVKLRTS